MSLELLQDFDPFKYLTKEERKELTLQEFNEEFDKSKEKMKENIKQLEEEEINKLNKEEEIRYKKSQLSSLLEFDNIKNKWSEYMFNIIKKTVSCEFNYSSIELVYLFITIILMIIIYFVIYSIYYIIKSKEEIKNKEYNINLYIKK